MLEHVGEQDLVDRPLEVLELLDSADGNLVEESPGPLGGRPVDLDSGDQQPRATTRMTLLGTGHRGMPSAAAPSRLI
jgi:hypothetical protein